MSKKNKERILLPGPVGIFLSGLEPGVAEGAIQSLAEDVGFANPPLIFCTKEMLAGTLEEALSGERTGEALEADHLPAVCLFSGLPLKPLQEFLTRFQRTGLPRPIFATTTEHNLKFTVKELLLHLLEERKMQQEQRQSE